MSEIENTSFCQKFYMISIDITFVVSSNLRILLNSVNLYVYSPSSIISGRINRSELKQRFRTRFQFVLRCSPVNALTRSRFWKCILHLLPEASVRATLCIIPLSSSSFASVSFCLVVWLEMSAIIHLFQLPSSCSEKLFT